MLRAKVTFLRIIIDVLAIFIISRFYFIGVEVGLKFVGVDLWFVRFTLGVIGIAVALLLFQWLYNVLFYLFKCFSIYSCCYPEEHSVLTALRGVLHRFTSVVGISTLTLAINKIFDEIADSLKVENATEKLASFINTEECPLLLKIGKTAKRVFLKVMSYADECVIAYCLKNKEQDTSECIVTGLAIFFKNIGKLSTKLITIVLLEYVLRALYYVVTILSVFKFGTITIDTIFTYFIIIRGGAFVFEDAILEPMMLEGIVTRFTERTDVDEELIHTIEDKFRTVTASVGLFKNKRKKQENATVVEEDTVFNEDADKELLE